MNRPRIAIVDTHPIQYHAPWYRVLGGRRDVEVQVLYCHKATPADQAKAGFGVEFDWDVSLLDGYSWEFLPNVAARPELTFRGLDSPELARRILERRYEAVVLNGWHYKSAWQAMRACRKSGTPVLVRSDSHLHSPRNPMNAKVKWPFYRMFIPRLDVCLPVGRWSREYFLHYGARPDRVFEVPHIVDSERIAKEAVGWMERRAELRRRWRLAEEDVVFVFAGKFIQQKRPLDFVRAIGQARSKGARICGLMVGDGFLRPACEAAVKESGAPIRFAGFLNQREMIQAYVAADALVQPSGGETWGLVVNEAMVCGRPCFVSDRVGCGPDLIEEGNTGAIYPCGNVERLAALLEQYADRQTLSAMGEWSRGKIRPYSPTTAAQRLVEAVSFTLERNGCTAA
jgi:glycosyltransferase involved in cell wall biosynthesis